MRKLLSFFALLVLIPAFAFASFNTDLGQGDRGPLVVELQNFLIAQGHLASGNNTGNFRALTKAAVQAFQTKWGIQPVSGFFGDGITAQLAALQKKIAAAQSGV